MFIITIITICISYTYGYLGFKLEGMRKGVRLSEEEIKRVEEACRKLLFTSLTDYFRFCFRVCFILEKQDFIRYVISSKESSAPKVEKIFFYLSKREERILKQYSEVLGVSESSLIRFSLLYLSERIQKSLAKGQRNSEKG